jgi:hypothetical protein
MTWVIWGSPMTLETKHIETIQLFVLKLDIIYIYIYDYIYMIIYIYDYIYIMFVFYNLVIDA